MWVQPILPAGRNRIGSIKVLILKFRIFSSALKTIWGVCFVQDTNDKYIARKLESTTGVNIKAGNLCFKLKDEASTTFPTDPANTRRSTLVNYTLNEDKANRINKISSIKQLNSVKDNNSKIAKGIAEFEIVNNNGNQYCYGLPVYARNEASLSFGVSQENVKNRYLAFEGNDVIDQSTFSTIKGRVQPDPYAVTYLLTQITGSNYIDVNGNGPDQIDLGGWTKFYYDRQYGGDKAWYRWRIPYNGLLFQQNMISDDKDDLGTKNSGEKEIYYLKAIETKSHIAFFVTNQTKVSDFYEYVDSATISSSALYIKGSGRARFDAMGAFDGNCASSAKVKGDQQLRYLEKIVLFSKADYSKPVQVTNLAYDYSLCKNLPNSYCGSFPNSPGGSKYNTSGKLTLKKVWTDYYGMINSRISPYKFSYEYFDAYPKEIKNQYPEIVNSVTDIPDDVENPDYSPYFIDIWGYHMYDGKNRFDNLQNWPWQGKIKDEKEKYDAGAWQLKQIQLPSGGQIHIQYEQNTYSSVQDRIPHTLVSLLPSSKDSGSLNGNAYDLNLADLGIDPNDSKSIDKVIHLIDSIYVQNKQKIFFKFLYGYRGSPSFKLKDSKSEYMTGYTRG